MRALAIITEEMNSVASRSTADTRSIFQQFCVHSFEVPMLAPQARIQTVIKKLDRLRTSAGVAQRVLQLMENPEFDGNQVVRLLESDPALAAQILKLVNSSYFGLSRKVASLRQAVACLGTHTLRLALLNFGVLQCMVGTMPAARREVFLRHSLTVAVVADKLSRIHQLEQPGEAYCAGLIVDIGVLALLEAEREAYLPLLENSAFDQHLAESERALFGFDHAELGARLIEAWKLPLSMSTAVAAHHLTPTANTDELALVVQVAAVTAEALWTPDHSRVADARTLLARHYELGVDDFIQLAMECKQWLQGNASIMSLELHSEIDVQQLRNKAMERFVAESVAAAVELDGVSALVDGSLSLPPC
jgi:HD-like signal output (HDOD) protein